MRYQMPYDMPTLKFHSTFSTDTRDLLTILSYELCDYFGISTAELYGKSRKTEVKYARWIMWKIMRSRKVSLKACGEIWMSKYDHTSVCNALNKLPMDVQTMPKVRGAYERVMKHDADPIPCP